MGSVTAGNVWRRAASCISFASESSREHARFAARRAASRGGARG